MTLAINEKHQKHEKLAQPDLGEWGRNEIAILGTNCKTIRQLCASLIDKLPYKIAYADAEHANADESPQSVSATQSVSFAEYTNKIIGTNLSFSAQPNAFLKRAWLNECDLVLVNGNHFTAGKQIIVIDEAKPLEKKLHKITDVLLILLKNTTSPIPDYLTQHLASVGSAPMFKINDIDAIGQFIQQYLETKKPLVNGLVLSGGKSTRMGSEKGNLNYHGTTQRNYLYQLLSPLCAQVFVSCNHQQASESENTLPVIEDSFLGLGPMGGILSAFRQHPDRAWLVVACDLPYLNEATITYLLRHRNTSKFATAFREAEGKFPEPLITIWEPKAYPVLLQFLAQGYSCPRKVLINSDVEMLHAPDPTAFTNVNTTEEYNQVMKTIQNKHNYC